MEVPNHIGIILDGNRRYAKKLLMKPWKGHEYGAKKIEKLFDWTKELGIKRLTLYTFSVKNFSSNDPAALEEDFKKARRRHSQGAVTIGVNGPNGLSFV